jgi:predicted nucleotidyltransferase
VHEFDCPRHRNDTIAIVGLAAFELAHFRLRVKVWSDGSNHFDSANAVGDCHHFVAINSLLASPGAPLPLD